MLDSDEDDVELIDDDDNDDDDDDVEFVGEHQHEGIVKTIFSTFIYWQNSSVKEVCRTLRANIIE